MPAHQFVEPTLHAVVRRPSMLGFVIAFGATSEMSTGHVLFGVHVAERDLSAAHGEAYADYSAGSRHGARHAQGGPRDLRLLLARCACVPAAIPVESPP